MIVAGRKRLALCAHIVDALTTIRRNRRRFPHGAHVVLVRTGETLSRVAGAAYLPTPED